jgi:hypothetical protein
MTETTKARAIECQKWADHYASEAAVARQHAEDSEGCKYRARALRCQRMAQINAATARAILAD